MIVSLIVAMSTDGLIGAGDRLPWRLPRDLARFRRLTWGKPIVMGRRTFASLGRPLEGRRNIVLTRRSDLELEGCAVVHSLPEAIALARADDRGQPTPELVVIGGAEVYREALPIAGRVYLTTVEGHFEGDVYFPGGPFDRDGWEVASEEITPADPRNPSPQRFAILNRRTEAPDAGPGMGPF